MRQFFEKHLNFRPTKRALTVVGAFALAGLVVGLVRTFSGVSADSVVQHIASLWMISSVLLAIFALYDWYLGLPTASITAHREVPKSFSLNRSQAIRFVLENNSDQALEVSFHDATPNSFVTSKFPLYQRVQAKQKGVFEYTATPKTRGIADFKQAYTLITSRFGLWQFVCRLGSSDDIKVYPDFSAISNSFVFGVEQAMRNMGAHIAKRKGDGMEFNQLREFREGDTLKQIDWKATARLGEPISREYQEEKDQNVVFLLDCSRRMRAMENSLSYFDYALNALLMSSYIALDKGDAVGVMTFSGKPSWLPPIKGKIAVNTILNHLFDLETSTKSSDYVSAAENLLLKQRKRSLIILLTNVRDEDNEDLEKAVSLLRGQHLVMVVALQERLVEKVDDLPVDNMEDALLYAGAKHFEYHRRKMLARVRGSGVSVVDATHKNIHIKLVTEYLRLKQSKQI